MTTTETDEAYSSLSALGVDQQFQHHVAQVRARAVLTEMLNDVPSYRWSYVPRQLAKNGTAAVLDLLTVADGTPEKLAELQHLSLRVARLWESLSKLSPNVFRRAALVNSAAAYEMAGYQANAVCSGDVCYIY